MTLPGDLAFGLDSDFDSKFQVRPLVDDFCSRSPLSENDGRSVGMLLNERVEGPSKCASLLNYTLNQGVDRWLTIDTVITINEQQG